VELLGALEKSLLGLTIVRIRNAALHGADRPACLVIVEPDALGAGVRVDDIDVVAFADRFVGALGFRRLRS